MNSLREIHLGDGGVLAYFELCVSYWGVDQGRLDRWRKQLKRRRVPDFGFNLSF